MDTKSKKSKPILGFLCFYFSIIILIGMLIAGAYAARSYDDTRQRLSDAFNPDFQNTYMFRQSMAYQLETMLDLQNKITDTSDSYWNSLSKDTGKNILYSVGTDLNPTQYSNHDLGLDLNNGTLPAGYNMKLYFDGKKVTITKDGKNIDLYGDGFYRENKGMWYLPGYSNLDFSEKNIENSRVTILVRKELVPSYGSSNVFSSIAYDQRNIRILVTIFGGIFLLWILLTALSILFRKDKKQADLALARFSGWFWWEFKVLCTILLIWADSTFISSFGGSNPFWWGICAVISFFCYYLVVNDIRYNPRFYKHSIFNSALKCYQEVESKKPFQKQIILRFGSLLAAEILLLLFGIFIISIGLFRSFTAFVFMLCLIGGMVYLIYRYVRKFQNMVHDIGLLIDQISLVKAGDLVTPLELPADADLCKATHELNTIQSGINKAVDERVKSEHMKIDLITNVSHDLKTPLTSIISYVDLLKQEDDLPDHVKDYIEVLAQKSDHLKNMVQDIFDVSKATSGNIELNMEVLDFSKLIRQTLADMNEEVEASGLTFKVEVTDKPVMIHADGQRLYRVFQNLIGNALQYSLVGSRVFVTLTQNESAFVASVKNTSMYELDGEKDMTERFVRGDSSRTTSGSGLGLSIARSFTEACGGTFHIRVEADLFIAEVGFNSITTTESL